jgi:hypothetical protein
MIRVRLSEHEAVEEEYFWPAVRKALPDGDDLAAKALEQEQQGKELLQHLARLDGGDDEFDELVEKLILALRTHVAFEDQVFLKVEDALSEGDRDELGRKIRKAKGGADA